MADSFASSGACMQAAHGLARAIGFDGFRALHEAVIIKGYQPGADRTAFTRSQTAFHIAQCFVWAADTQDRSERLRWVRCGHKHAFFGWAAGRFA